MTGVLRGLLLLALLVPLAPGRAAGAPGPETVVAVEIVADRGLEDGLAREAVEGLVGRPLARGAVRDRLARLWALGIFDDVRVEERSEAGGVRLRFHVRRRPILREVRFRGDLGIPAVDLAGAAGLALGGDASDERLAEARRAMLDRLRAEGYFGADLRTEVEPDPGTAARTVTAVVNAGEPARLGPLRVVGLNRAPEDAGRALGLREGARYRQSAVRESVRALEAHLRDAGFPAARVEAAPPRWSRDTNRVALTLTVAEGPRVRVELSGNEAIADEPLRERMTFDLAGAVDEAELRASIRQIEAAYREQGYAFVAAGGTLRREGEDVVVRVSIVEGPRVAVESVVIEGVPADRAAALRARLETRPTGWLRRDVYRADAVERDVRALAAVLAAEGFARARVGPPAVTFSEDRTRSRITIPVVEGPRLTVGRVELTGAVTLDEAALRRALDLAPGTPWSEAAVEQGRRVLERRYARAGRLAARVEAASEPRDGVVDVTYTIAEGPLTRVGRVLVRGLTRTRLAVVTRELPLAPGDPLDPEALVEAQRRLGALGIFEVVDVDPLRPAPTPFADVTVTVREGKPWHLAGGVGYSTFERARVFVEAGHDNILGTARSLALRLRASERGERADVLYREPWLLGTPWVGEGNLFYEQRDEIGYDLERVGLALGVQRDLWVERIRGLRGAVRYEIARVDRSDVDPTLLEEHVREGTEVIASVTNEVTLDRRDHPLDPRRGSFHLASLEVGGAALGGEADFVKARLETAWFLDWLPPGVLAVGLRLGLATTLGNTVEIPIEKRFFAGGATTVRGYRERRLGPLDDKGNPTGGDGFLVLNLEWRFPIWRWLGGAVFFDTGAVTARATDLAPDELRSGVGAGLRVASPVGPVRLDVAYPLDSVPGQEQTFRVYVTVGYPF